jgi:hypothetical protein
MSAQVAVHRKHRTVHTLLNGRSLCGNVKPPLERFRFVPASALAGVTTGARAARGAEARDRVPRSRHAAPVVDQRPART